MQTIDTQTLHDLEFTTIQNWLAEFAIGPTAKNRLEQLSPIKELHLIRPTLGKLKEFHTIRTSGESFPSLLFEVLPIS